MDTQLMPNYEQPNTPITQEKLPGIDKLHNLEEHIVPSSPYSSMGNEMISTKHQSSCSPQVMLPSSAYLPPPTNVSYNTFNPNMITSNLYHQNMSPPLTPAVSPSSVLLDSMQFKRKFSVDVGPFSFGTNIQHPSSMADQDAYRRSSCSAMSVDDCVQGSNYSNHPATSVNAAVSAAVNAAVNAAVVANGHSRLPPSNEFNFLNSNPMQDPSFANSTTTTTKNSGSRRGSRAQLTGPNTQHKHACKYAYCQWSFKRYEHLKRHMLVHTGKRPHICQYPGCGKSFSRSDNFHAHCRTHTKKSGLLQQQSSNKRQQGRNNKNNNQSSHSLNGMLQNAGNHSATAAAVAAVAAAASVSSSTGAVHSNAEVFDDRHYFPKPAEPSFAIAYQDIYGHRNAYAPENTHDYSPQQHHHYMRTFNHPAHFELSNGTNSANNIQVNGLNPPSPSGVSSLLNHEISGQHHPFFPTSTNDQERNISPFGYSITSTTMSPSNNMISHHSHPPNYHSNSNNNNNNNNNNRNSYGYANYTLQGTTNNTNGTHLTTNPITRSNGMAPMNGVHNSSHRRTSNSSGENSAAGSQQKLHKCPVAQCHRDFKRLEHLKRHMRIHTHEKPFACSFPGCHKMFSRSDNLSQHMKTHQRVEDRRRRQHQQQSHEEHMFNTGSTTIKQEQQHLPPLHQTSNNGNGMNGMVNLSWQSTGTVGC
ncbi:hypothetical protein BDB01DRAFT_895778 [Pilobolus umbonatus]|nr:hypothetical protein BDB01DRAFT_895778 [Pilobolus umbonatus]